MDAHILTLNAGSSSIKFALFAISEGGLDPRARVTGQVEGLGATPHFIATAPDGAILAETRHQAGDVADHRAAIDCILQFLDESFHGAQIAAVGHRVVHGGAVFDAPAVLDDAAMQRLEVLVPLAPLHQPHNLSGVRAARSGFPDALQVACFDTAFHRTQPWVNDTFALPRRYHDAGVRRYGFHGLSYEYVTGEVARRDPVLARGRMVVAHLGNGASLCAIRDGRSVGSTMGFTALDGLPMGTRCGQIDPGVVLYLMETEGMSHSAISTLLYKESGLKGLSGLSQDMRTLEAAGTLEADQAIAYFTARIRQEVGAMAALIGGLDGLVFCGGIGEHSQRVRAEVVGGLGWLGVTLDDARNRANGPVVSSEGSAVPVLVVRTDEEVMIARHTYDCLDATSAAAQPAPPVPA